MANPNQQPQNNGDQQETVEGIQFANKMLFPQFGLLERICANPPTGKGWIIKPHREGFKVTHPDLTKKHGWWVVYRANIAGTNVDVPATEAK